MNIPLNHPFSNVNFLNLLENSKCVDEKSGWSPHHFYENDSLLPSYIKSHSFGEYIFDWSWAQFYQHNNLNYYPKLLHAIPFTPVNGPKVIGDQNYFEDLIHKSFEFYQSTNLSSEHYLFIDDEEQNILENFNFTTKFSHQYHFLNNYESFDHFLDKLKKNRRKNILKERKKNLESDLTITRHFSGNISEAILERLYYLYLQTISKKGSYAYLTKEFFQSLNNQSALVITAQKNEEIIAMALFFYDHKTLYGRNWGILRHLEDHFPYLHFELCYYQGIEFCIEKGLSRFEAGAQGEHKLLRGFTPTLIKSSHHIKIPQYYEIIKKNIFQNNIYIKNEINHLNQYLPFKA